MRTLRIAETLLFPVALLVFPACSDKKPEPAPQAVEITEVRTTEQAKELFLEKIAWEDSSNTRATLWKDLLRTNAAIGETNSDPFRYSSEPEWMLAIDNMPGAYFSHPVTYAFISYANPSIQTFSRSSLPNINYKSVWEGVASFLNDPEVVYSNSWLDNPPQRPAEETEAPAFTHWPPRMAEDTCINEKRSYAVLIHNLENLDTSPETVANLHIMAESLKASGYNVRKFMRDPVTGETFPYLNLAADRGDGIYELKNFVAKHRDFNDCCEEILVYITGETGVVRTKYSSQTYFDLPFRYKGEAGTRKATKRFFAEDLALIFNDLKTCHVNVVVDANFASGFVEDLISIPQVESVVASCQDNEYTISSAVETLDKGAFQDPFGIEDGEVGSEFTSSFVKGIIEQIKSENGVKAHQLAKKGFDASLLYDMGYLGGQTTPVAISRTMDSDCPCGVDTEKTRF